jgi:hypothetical protein
MRYMTDDQLRRILPKLDLEAFWEDSEYADDTYGGGYPSDDVIGSVEAELGFRLPAS